MTWTKYLRVGCNFTLNMARWHNMKVHSVTSELKFSPSNFEFRFEYSNLCSRTPGRPEGRRDSARSAAEQSRRCQHLRESRMPRRLEASPTSFSPSLTGSSSQPLCWLQWSLVALVWGGESYIHRECNSSLTTPLPMLDAFNPSLIDRRIVLLSSLLM